MFQAHGLLADASIGANIKYIIHKLLILEQDMVCFRYTDILVTDRTATFFGNTFIHEHVMFSVSLRLSCTKPMQYEKCQAHTRALAEVISLKLNIFSFPFVVWLFLLRHSPHPIHT